VQEKSAREVALKFYYERMPEHLILDAKEISITGTQSVYQDNITLYYVFNMSAGGFVAVAASLASQPILCYSFEGSYTLLKQPANFRAWMSQYQQQLVDMLNDNLPADEKTAELWQYYLETPIQNITRFSEREVAPLLTSTWNQGIFYNEYCPADNAGPAGHCVTGCVATAMGQLLNYFRWPESGTGSYSYECPPYGTLSADFAASQYEWDYAENSLGHSNEEVAEILYHLGVSVDMVYGPDGSGMYNHKAAYSLKTYFKFSPETQYVFRDSTSMDWDSLLVTHLDRQIPMYYAGWSVPDIVGHAFVCDGYQGENFYHFNWGWGGSYDGYFYTGNLNPGGSNFNLAQELIIHAFPDTNLYDYPVNCSGQKNLTSLFGTIDDGSGPMYPYENGAACSWLIIPEDSINGINLNFLQFGLDSNDVLTIYEGESTNAPVLGAFTGTSLPGPVSTDSTRLLMVFESDSALSHSGFTVHYSSVLPVYCSGMEMMTAQTDSLSDGSGNWNYHNSTICLWRIVPEGASSVTLYFNGFETEEGFDMLKIYDLESQELLAEYSGSYFPEVPAPVTSTSGKMFVAFNTNTYQTAPGWSAYYESNLVGIAENTMSQNISIYPNPSSGLIHLRFSQALEEYLDINVLDLSGRTVKKDMIRPGALKASFALDMLSPGIYILQVTTENGNEEYHKIVIH
jgi:hypothetical protein